MTSEAETCEPVLFAPDESLDMVSDMLERALTNCPDGDWAETVWPLLTDLGILEAVAGPDRLMEGSGRLAGLVCRLLGQAGRVTPFAISSAVAASMIGDVSASSPLVREMLGEIAAGKSIATLAVHEDDALPVTGNLGTRLSQTGVSWALSGEKRMAPFAGQADWMLVPAELANCDPALVLLRASDFAPDLRPYRLIDETPAADLVFAGLPVDEASVLCTGDVAARVLARMQDALTAACCADATGAMRAAIDATGEYLGVRRQFGEPLSSNQALRHRFVDIEIALAKAQTMSMLACAALEEECPASARAIADQARYIVIRAAWQVSQETMQMHGAIGMADETPLGTCFKRLLATSLWLGDEDQALTASGAH